MQRMLVIEWVVQTRLGTREQITNKSLTNILWNILLSINGSIRSKKSYGDK